MAPDTKSLTVPRRQPLLILPRAIGAVGPDLRGGVLRRHQPRQHPPVRLRGGGHRALPDEAETPVDRDMGFVAEHRQGDPRQGRPIGTVADLAADLQRPAGIDVLLRRLVRLVRPDLLRRLAGLDRFLLAVVVALLRRRHQRGIDDLARHRDVALLLQLPVEGLHHPPQRAGLRQPVAEVPDRVLVRRRPAEVEAQEAHPGQPVPDHELHLRVAQIVLRLKDQRLEHRDRVERWTSAPGSVAVAEPLDQPDTEILKVDGAIQNLKRIAVPTQPLKMLRQPEKRPLFHEPACRPCRGRVNHEISNTGRFLRASSSTPMRAKKAASLVYHSANWHYWLVLHRSAGLWRNYALEKYIEESGSD